MTAALRIAFLDSWPQAAAEGSGTAVAIGGLAAALKRAGHHVDRIAPAAITGPLLWRRLHFNLTLPQRLAQASYDLVVGVDIDGVRWARRAPMAYVCSLKGVLADEARCERGWPRLLLWGLSRLERRHARHAPLVLATSTYSAGRITALYGVPAERIQVVPEGLDPRLWGLAPGDEGTDGAAGAQDSQRERWPATVLCVARQYPRKRVADLIDAFALLAVRCPRARLVVIGDGPDHHQLQQQVKRLGLGSVVQLLGAVADDREVRRWYQRASLFCLPSVQEGFGIVFLEAMASGLPVVSTTATAIPEVVPHGQAGLLVPPRDPAALAAAIETLLHDPQRLAAARLAGRRQALRYGWDQVADRFLTAVAPLLADRQGVTGR